MSIKILDIVEVNEDQWSKNYPFPIDPSGCKTIVWDEQQPITDNSITKFLESEGIFQGEFLARFCKINVKNAPGKTIVSIFKKFHS